MPFPKATLSQHALDRLAERSALSPTRLLDLLNRQLGPKVGCSKKRSHLVHRLYWSPDDSAPFVVVQDVVNGTVLTVLTLDMYRNRHPDNITGLHIRRVVNQAVLAGVASANFWIREDKNPAVLVHVGFLGDQPSSLGYWNGLDRPDLDLVGRCREFWEWVVAKLGDRGRPIEGLEWVSARFPGGDPRFVALGC